MAYLGYDNKFGFVWGEVLVERVASNDNKPKFQVVRVHAPNGTGVDIVMTPRTVRIQTFKKEKK